jgi:hypothetical protein
MNVYYVYVYLDPRKPGKFKYDEFEFDYEPFYVGKGTKSRLLRHLKEINRNPIKISKISKIRNEGKDPIILKILDKLTNEDSLKIEKRLIKKIGRVVNKTGPLTNYTEGGETYLGYKHQEDYLNRLHKPVVKYDLDGNIIGEYKSVKEAGEMNNIHPQTISQICNGGIKIYKDKYIFLYKGVEFESRFRGKKEYPVIRIDFNFNKKEYKSATEAADDINTTVSRIVEVCSGNRFQTSGYLFRYKNHPNQKKFEEKINQNYSKYLNIIDREIEVDNIIYKNILQAISNGKNVKINNIYKKISKFNEFKST